MTDLRNSRFRSSPRLVLMMLALSLIGSSVAFATAPADMSYWVSMRGITEDAQPSFVPASYTQTGEYSIFLAGCHGRNLYLRPGDAALVQASKAAGETVQIHEGEPGTQAQQSTVICLIQIDR